jgi:hypothetical protein
MEFQEEEVRETKERHQSTRRMSMILRLVLDKTRECDGTPKPDLRNQAVEFMCHISHLSCVLVMRLNEPF